jgi:hypothetical protein
VIDEGIKAREIGTSPQLFCGGLAALASRATIKNKTNKEIADRNFFMDTSLMVSHFKEAIYKLKPRHAVRITP